MERIRVLFRTAVALRQDFRTLVLVLLPGLVIALSLVSASTTFLGLSYFTPAWMAATITACVQTVVVLCGLYAAEIYARGHIARSLAVFTSLIACGGTSVYFSYFAFAEKS